MHLNKVQLIGRLGKDPELKYTPNGVAVAEFSLATSSKVKDQEVTEWHNIKVWDKRAEVCAKYLKKGSLVYVEGRIETRSWEKDGQKRYKTEIVAGDVQFGPKEGSGASDPGAYRGSEPAISSSKSPGFGGASKIDDEEIPF